MTKGIYLSKDAIIEILNLSATSDKPLSDKIIGKLGQALGLDADKMINRHQELHQEWLAADDSEDDDSGSFAIIHREGRCPVRC